MSVGVFMFLRTFDSVAIPWLWFLVVIAFLPRETYKVYRMLMSKMGKGKYLKTPLKLGLDALPERS